MLVNICSVLLRPVEQLLRVLLHNAFTLFFWGGACIFLPFCSPPTAFSSFFCSSAKFFYGALLVALAHRGKVSSLNMSVPHVLIAKLMHRMPIKFSTKPAFAMSRTLRVPYENAMALGGVATGSMKAMEALMVQGSMTYRGWSFIVEAIEARMGRKSVVVAVLLEHSVNIPTSRHSNIEMANGGML